MIKRLALLLSLTASLSVHSTANASGFALIEQSVSGMGNAYAGGAALAEDASTVFFNPAGMTRLCGLQTVSGNHIVIPIADYDDKGSLAAPLPSTLNGGDGRDAGEAALVGHWYAAKKLNDCWSVGMGINSPFGLATDYQDSWKGRYHAVRSYLLTINLNPSIAYRINRCWSIGAGLNVQYLHAKLTNKVDFGLIALSNGIIQGDPQNQDGRVKLKGNSWGYGGNIGVLWEPNSCTRFGAHFRSEIKHEVSGKERFKEKPAVITGVSGLDAIFQDTRAHSDVTLPSTLSLSGYHELNDCWAIMGDVSWTKWSTIKRLRFRFNNPSQPDGITTLKWKDSMRYSLGASYRPNCRWVFRSGIAYDETPVPNKELRSPRIPDADRFWTAIGVGYEWRCFQFDFGYAHLFVRTPKIDKSDFALEEDILRGGLKGKYDAYTDIISFQWSWHY